MITELEGVKYILEGDNGETQLIDFTKIPESEILFCLMDRMEFLMETDSIGYESEIFKSLVNTLDYYYKRKRKGEISDKIQ